MQLIAFIDPGKFRGIIPKCGPLWDAITEKVELDDGMTVNQNNLTHDSILYFFATNYFSVASIDTEKAKKASILFIPDTLNFNYVPQDYFIILKHSNPTEMRDLLIKSENCLAVFEGREDSNFRADLKNRYPELIDYLNTSSEFNFDNCLKKVFPEFNPKLIQFLNTAHKLSIKFNEPRLNQLFKIMDDLTDYGLKSLNQIRSYFVNHDVHKQHFSSDFSVIWDEESSPSLAGIINVQPIKSESDFENEDFKSKKQIYILVEINWGPHSRSEFHGFTLAKEIRRMEIKCPIIFCSFVNYFNPEHFPDARIRKTSGHYFLHLPDLINPDLYNFFLDNNTLDDVNTHMSDLQALRDIFHNTNDTIAIEVSQVIDEDKNERKVKKTEKAKTFMLNALDIFSKSISKDKSHIFNTIKENIVSDIEKIINQESFEDNQLRGILDKYKGQLYDLLPKKISDTSLSKPKRKNWEVLFIDDVRYNCETLANNFDRNGITCQTANNACEAYKALEVDEQGAKKIAVVIADFRLFNNGDDQGDWQEEQGYAILRKIATNGRFTSLYIYIMLTSKEGSIKDNIKKSSGFPVLWFHKNDVLGGLPHSFDIFCQRIIEVGDDMYLKKRSVPQIGGWVKGITNRIWVDYTYSFLYKLHITDKNYSAFELKINENAKELLKQNCLPLEHILAPTFNPRNGENDLLSLFRATILIYRRIFLKMRIIDKLSDFEIFNYFNNNKDSKGGNKNQANKNRQRIDLTPEERKEKQENDKKSGLFNNWGFELNTLNNKPCDILLYEERSFLNSFDSIIYLTDTEIADLEGFFDQISRIDFNNEINVAISGISNRCKSGTSGLLLSDVEDCIKKIEQCYLEDKKIKNAMDKTWFIKDIEYLEVSENIKPLFKFLDTQK